MEQGRPRSVEASGAPWVVSSLFRLGEVGIHATAIDRYLEAQPCAAAYHAPVFLEVLRRECALACRYFVAFERTSKRICGVLPVALSKSALFGCFATSLPFVNYGGVLAESDEVAQALVAAAWRWAASRGARDLTLRHMPGQTLALEASGRKETVVLPLPAGDAEALWKAIGPKPRNLVRKAQRSGCEACCEPDTARAVATFHRLYAENMRDLGTPSMPERFFHALARALGERFAVHVVRYEGEPAGAAISVLHGERYEVPWAATLRRFRPQAANMLLYWHLMREATATGANLFDFGRSTPGSGPYRFKLQWRGSRAEPLPWYVVGAGSDGAAGSLNPDNPRYARAIALWRRLPVGLTRTIGGMLARRLP